VAKELVSKHDYIYMDVDTMTAFRADGHKGWREDNIDRLALTAPPAHLMCGPSICTIHSCGCTRCRGTTILADLKGDWNSIDM